jgi:hypothetical protein
VGGGDNIQSWYIFFWVFPQRLNIRSRRFGTLGRFHLHRWVGVIIHTYTPVKTEPTELSETSAFNIQTAGKYPEEIIACLQQGESLKTTIIIESCLVTAWQSNWLTSVALIKKPQQPHYGSSYNNLIASFYYRSSRLVDNLLLQFLDLYMQYEFRKLKQRHLGKHIGSWQNTAKTDIKETGWWVLDWIYLIEVKFRSRAFVNMVMKFELLCNCQRVKKCSTPLIIFVTRHNILDLVNQRGKQVL